MWIKYKRKKESKLFEWKKYQAQLEKIKLLQSLGVGFISVWCDNLTRTVTTEKVLEKYWKIISRSWEPCFCRPCPKMT